MDKETRQGKFCQYCGNLTEIKKTKFGNVSECIFCGAYVSVDEDDIPKGITANTELRNLRRTIHYTVDKLIYMKMEKDNVSKNNAKNALYAYINTIMNFDFEFKSIAQLSESEINQLSPILKKAITNGSKTRKSNT